MIPELRVTLQGAATGDFNGMSSQSHISHFRDTCHIAVTWQNQCHDIAECNISIRHIKNIFRQFFIYFLFCNEVSALTSGGFRIVSDTLVTLAIIT